MIGQYLQQFLLSTALAIYAPLSSPYQNPENPKLEDKIRTMADIAVRCGIHTVTPFYIFSIHEYFLPPDINQRPSFIFQDGTGNVGIDGILGTGDRITITFRNGQSITTNGKRGFSAYWDPKTWMEADDALTDIIENFPPSCEE